MTLTKSGIGRWCERCGNLTCLLVIVFFIITYATAQTASTGAVVGSTLDASGALVAGATVQLLRRDRVKPTSTLTDNNGHFGFLLVQPGVYSVTAYKTGFSKITVSAIRIPVTETVRVYLRLPLPTHSEEVNVSSNSASINLENLAPGRIVTGESLKELPLATRNFTQIATLSPGVISGVYNAGQLGVGGTALSQIGKSNDGVYAHGSRSYDNEWQIDGVSVRDVLGSGTISGGMPIPNPDTIQEFKVQTGLYDATFGRGAGANISIVTKEGGKDFHGTLFEFLRNEALNANDYFRNKAGQKRPELNQHQFGFSFGGPIRKDKLLFFSSYQGTRQKNGLAAGQSRVACAATMTEPPLTNDRSPAALGELFGGNAGALGGVAVAPDGSNINPAAISLLNFKLPDGSFLIPTPQVVDSSKPLENQGFSAFSQPCTFNEDQFLLNLDWELSSRNSISSRFFFANDDQLVTFPGGALNPVGNARGFNSPGNSQFALYSLTHRYQGGSSWLGETKFAYVRTVTQSKATAPFKWSDVGVAEGEMNNNNELPSLSILGSISMSSVLPRSYEQHSFALSNVISFLRGSHTFKLGGSLTRFNADLHLNGAGSYLQFQSWPDFLLGLDANSNGTGMFSNVFGSSDIYGLLDRELDVWEGSGFVQDNYRVLPTVAITAGLRYERIGHFGEDLGRNSSFDITKANPHPPSGGSLEGYIVGSNYPGAIPTGVTRADNTFGIYGKGQNAFGPRLGFAWQVLPKSSFLTVRAGYGIYYSRPTGQTSALSILAAPFASTRFVSGAANAAASFQFPFAQPFPQPGTFPSFEPYSPTSNIAVTALSPNFRPALVQQFSLGTEWEITEAWSVHVDYVGTRGTHLQRYRSLNQALQASSQNPINGITTDTLDNIDQRVPIPGIRPDSLRETESEGNSWYHGLEISVTKQMSHGVQFLSSYTFSKTLDSDGADVNSTSANNALTLGDQNSPAERWGRASFDRTHRFVLSAVWTLPSPARGLTKLIIGDWALAAIGTVQSGSALTIAATNSRNVFGISQDRAELTGTCSTGQLMTPGTIESKLNNYFNTSCFTTAPVIGADGIGTAFGNSGTGIIDGPGQANLDLSLSKLFSLNFPRENSSIQLRAEFFNVLNHPQFASPDANFSSPTFGAITSTSVNARVGQIALKFTF